MIDMAKVPNNAKILEPSCGEGIFGDLLIEKGFDHLTAYEIDNTIAKQFPFVKHTSFVSADIREKFDLIIGNPSAILGLHFR